MNVMFWLNKKRWKFRNKYKPRSIRFFFYIFPQQRKKKNITKRLYFSSSWTWRSGIRPVDSRGIKKWTGDKKKSRGRITWLPVYSDVQLIHCLRCVRPSVRLCSLLRAVVASATLTIYASRPLSTGSALSSLSSRALSQRRYSYTYRLPNRPVEFAAVLSISSPGPAI